MQTPTTDRTIEWIRTMRTLGEADGTRIADELAALPAHRKAAAVDALLAQIERFSFGPERSQLGEAASQELGAGTWDDLHRSIAGLRAAIQAELRAAEAEQHGADAAG